MICFVGASHAPQTLKAAAIAKGMTITDNPEEASLVFVAEDTPTDGDGKRDLTPIRNLALAMLDATKAPIILSSQVPPGFTRRLRNSRVVHMAETLRMKDAMERAMNPEQFIFGVPDPTDYKLPLELLQYAWQHAKARVLVMSYESAEFAKIAINAFLAAQVDCANRLVEAARKVDAKWSSVADALKCDRRIGPHAYLTPGRWQDSMHLMRDAVTLKDILAR